MEHAVLRLRERLKRQEDLLARLVEEAEQEARLQEDAEVRAVEAALQEAERKQAEAAQRVAEVRARLAARKKKASRDSAPRGDRCHRRLTSSRPTTAACTRACRGC